MVSERLSLSPRKNSRANRILHVNDIVAGGDKHVVKIDQGEDSAVGGMMELAGSQDCS